MVPWSNINTVFLDMDGTLLDLHFDNHFWLEHVPQRYGEARGLSFAEAKAELLARYRSREGTLEWYCIDHWSRELGLDIALLKEEVHHLIAVHPHVVGFLDAVRAAGGVPYTIAGGGSTPLGALGYAACAAEIMAQSFDLGVAFDAIVVASGSAGTHSGLLAGLVALNAGVPLTGINVRRPRAEQETNVHKLAVATAQLLGVAAA